MSGDAREQITELLHTAQAMTPGPNKVAICEQAVALADHHQDIDAGFASRRKLVQSATFAGMPNKSMVAFAWCLAQCDADPERFPETRVLWQYKWVVMSLHGFPEIPRERIEAATEDIDTRYRRCGLSLRPIHRIRLISARGMGDHDVARQSFERWIAAPRDEFTDCAACETSTHVGYLIDQGRDEEAMVAARPLLTGQLRCATQPEITYARVLLPLLRMGTPKIAVPRHLEGYRRIRRQPHYYTTTIGQHMVFLALTGNVDRAVQLFVEHLPLGLDDSTPSDRFHFFLSCRLTLERVATSGRELLELRLPPTFGAYRVDGRYPLIALIEWFDTQIAALADRFNPRNGNRHFSEISEQHAGLRAHATAHPIRA